MRLMKIITTRTQPGGDAFVQRLRTLGHDALCVPVLRAQALPFQSPDMTGIEGLIVTSAHALRHCRLTPSDMPVYTVGAATAVQAREMGWTRVTEGPGDVLSMGPSLKGKGALLHLCAGQVSVDTERAFTGLNVVSLAVYETVPDAGFPACFENLQDGVVMVHSARAAALLRPYVRAYRDRMQAGAIIFLCLSQPVLESLIETSLVIKGAYSISTPTEDALINALKDI